MRSTGDRPNPARAERASIAWMALALCVLAVIGSDQVSKQIAIASVERGDASEIMFGVEIVNVRNDGIAFGLLSGSKLPLIGFTLLATAALLAYFASNPLRPGLWLAAGLLAGGALSNLFDRLREGAVIDFVDFPAWPAFNLADVAIVLGAIGLAFVIARPAGASDG